MRQPQPVPEELWAGPARTSPLPDSGALDTQSWSGTDTLLAPGPASQHPNWVSECDLEWGAGSGPPWTPCLVPPTPLRAHVASPARGRACPTRVTTIHTRAADKTLITEPTTATPPWSVSPSSRGGLNPEQLRGHSHLRQEPRSHPASGGHAARSTVALRPPGTGEGPFCGRGLTPVHAYAVIGTSGSSASSVVAAGSPLLLLVCGPPVAAPFPLWPHLCDQVAGKRGGGTEDGENFKI